MSTYGSKVAHIEVARAYATTVTGTSSQMLNPWLKRCNLCVGGLPPRKACCQMAGQPPGRPVTRCTPNKKFILILLSHSYLAHPKYRNLEAVRLI
jgi:hypothetical protein